MNYKMFNMCIDKPEEYKSTLKHKTTQTLKISKPSNDNTFSVCHELE